MAKGLMHLVRESGMRRRLNEELELKLDDEQYKALMRFRRNVEREFHRRPFKEEYMLALKVLGPTLLKRRKAKKKGTRKDRLYRIISKRYGVPDSLLEAFIDQFENEY
jgi:hypothetical protein